LRRYPVRRGHVSRAAAIATVSLACLFAAGASAAPSTGSISGLVTDSHGAPLPGVAVSAIGLQGQPMTAVTAADGSYTIASLADSAYWVLFAPPSSATLPDPDNYLSQYYAGVADRAGPPPVVVSGTANTTGIDAELQPGGAITGTVTDSAGDPVAGAAIELYAPGSARPQRVSADTASDGSYSIDRLPAGYYAVEVQNYSNADYLPTFFGGTAVAAGAFGVAVGAGATESRVDIRALQGAELTGRVTDASASPVTGESVTPIDASGSFAASATTAADGTYELAGLPSGSYRVEFSPAITPAPTGLGGQLVNYLAQFYDGVASAADATPVEATDGAITPNIDAKLAVGGEIQGTVTDAAHEALADAQVVVYQSDGSQVGGATTASDGTYTVAALPSGIYKLGVSGFAETPDAVPGFAPSFYGASTLAAATPISVSAGSAATGVDVQVTTGAVISGTIEDALGTPLAQTTATAYDAAGTAVASAVTAPFLGTYSIGGLAAGTYRVGFAGAGSAPQSVGGVTVASGGSHGGVDVQMQPGGDVAGSVTAASGAPISGVEVTLTDAAGSSAGATSTSSDGSFDIGALASGTYRIAFVNEAGQTVIAPAYYGGSSLADAAPVSVTQSETTRVSNMTLTLITGGISGVVTDKSGKPLSGAAATVYDTSGNVVGASRATASDGSYSIDGLDPGFYRVGFSHGGYVAQLYADASSLSASQAFYVAPAQTASGIDAALSAAPPQLETIPNPLPSVTLGPLVLLRATTRTRLVHGHRFSLALTCLAATGCDVRATATLKRHGHRTVVAVGAIHLEGISNGRITLRLRPVGIKLFRGEHGHMRVTVRLAVSASGAPTMRDSESVVIV